MSDDTTTTSAANWARWTTPPQWFPETPAWQALARCRGESLALFHPDVATPAATRVAIRICRGCPVRVECLAHALEHGETGVWGGKTYQERRAMRRGTRA